MNQICKSLRSEISTVTNEGRLDFLMHKLRSYDEATYKHSVRVANILVDFAKQFNVTKNSLDMMYNSALLHDIGKLCVHKGLLQKDGNLTTEEWELLKNHARYSNNIVEKLLDANVDYDMILHHHENIDGSGYFTGLKDSDLSFNVRLIRIVDSFEAMTANRSYSKALPVNDALFELKKCKSFYDQTLVSKFTRYIESY